MYAVLGASGNTGSVVAKTLLEKDKKVRVVGRHLGKLQQFIQRGAEAAVGDITNVTFLAKVFTDVEAAYLMIPPNMTSPDYRTEQDRTSDAVTAALQSSGLKKAVFLSSYGSQHASGTGPIAGLSAAEKKFDAVPGLDLLNLRAAYFLENHLAAINMIQMMGVFGAALKPDLKIPMIAARDIGAYAAQRLLALDFTGKQSQELLGERDLTMTEVASTISRALNRSGLRYAQFPYDQVEQVLLQMGVPAKTVALFVEMFRGINEGLVVALGPRSAANTTPTSIESWVKQVFVPAFQGQAAAAE